MVEITSEEAYRAYLLIELLRSTGEREFPMQLATTFFWIAAHDGCKQGDLEKAVSMSSASVSRNVSWLSSKHRIKHRKGLELIIRRQDPDNYKARRLFLTPKGKQFVQLLECQLNMPIEASIKATEAMKARNQNKDVES